MNIFENFPLIILAYFSIKFLIKFIEENIFSIREKLDLIKIENGIVSINDLQTNNYPRFLELIKLYLTTHGYENIIISPDASSELTSMEGILNGEKVYINCFQNKKLSVPNDNDDNFVITSISTIQCYLARMFQNNCSKGLVINNSTFSLDTINFIENYNSKNLNSQIILVDGYELTRAIRNYKNYNIKVGNENETI